MKTKGGGLDSNQGVLSWIQLSQFQLTLGTRDSIQTNNLLHSHSHLEPSCCGVTVLTATSPCHARCCILYTTCTLINVMIKTKEGMKKNLCKLNPFEMLQSYQIESNGYEG